MCEPFGRIVSHSEIDPACAHVPNVRTLVAFCCQNLRFLFRINLIKFPKNKSYENLIKFRVFQKYSAKCVCSKVGKKWILANILTVFDLKMQ